MSEHDETLTEESPIESKESTSACPEEDDQTRDDADSLDDEPTEEEVALAMHLSTSSNTLDGNSVGVDGSKDCDQETETEGEAQCLVCGSAKEPYFVHFKKAQITGITAGEYIWRYRCGKKECGQFFGDFYAYDRTSNAFVKVSEDGAVVEDATTEHEHEELRDDSVIKEHEQVPDDSIVKEHEQVAECATQADEAQVTEQVSETSVEQKPEVSEEKPAVHEEKSEKDLLEGTSVQHAPSEEKQEVEQVNGDIVGPTMTSRSRRRQRVTARKKTAVTTSTSKAKSTPACIVVEQSAPLPRACKSAPSTKASPKAPAKTTAKAPPKAPMRTAKSHKPTKATKASAPKRRREKASDHVELANPVKKARKGYVYEAVPSLPSVPVSVIEVTPSIPTMPKTSVDDSATQTLGRTHYFSAMLEQLINSQAELCAGSAVNPPSTLPTHVSRRLMITQNLLKRQSQELQQAHEENKRLVSLVALMNSVIKKFRDEYTPELRNLRDAIGVLKREFAFYQEEFVIEAKKSIDNIAAQKLKVQQRIDDMERKHMLLNARIDLHVKEKEAIEERADGYLRDISSRDRDVILANKARDRAERKLNDTLYVANNAKCAHCQISDKMRKHLTDVVAEKTVLLEKCQKECLDAKKRAEQSDRISHILSKDSEKLKFELNRWKSDAERNITEISRLKEELRKLTSTVPPNSTYAPQSRIEPQTPKDSPHTTGSLVSHSVSQSPISQSPAYTDPKKRNSSPDEPKKQLPSDDGPILKPPPPPPQMPTPPEETDAMFNAWLPKEPRRGHSPQISFFNSSPAGSRHENHPSMRNPFNGPVIREPFNGPVIRDPFNGPRRGRSVSRSGFMRSPGEDMWGNAGDRNHEVLREPNSHRFGEPSQSVGSRTPTDNFAKHHSPRQEEPCPRDTVPMIGKLPSRITKAKAGKVDDATISNGEKKGTVPNNEENATISDAEKNATISNGEKNEKTSASVPPVVAAQSRIAEPKESIKKGKAKNKNKKKKKMLHAAPFGFPIKTMQPGPAFKAAPFNGPASHLKSGPSIIQEAAPHPAETIRTRFSSSPLPWHRAEAAAAPVEYNAWERGFPPSLPQPFERRSLLDSDLVPNRPFIQKTRRNFWEP
ncbi:unnamed protein product [Cylicocyclus nassatus]|uniref:Uncharacterized protein n=1 Tax=Cylicocyclus nassatus TaxID=53992 RepID=A0AA36DSD2_CYLNA|nr:unnamed protein product [Cylicocyclus nassatus]